MSAPQPSPQRLNDPISAHLRLDTLTLCAEDTAAGALASLRNKTVGEKIVYFYVVADDNRLVGVVPTRRLLMADPQSTVGDLMVHHVVAIPDSASVLDACELFLKHRFLALPVVNAEGRLLGLVDISLFTEELSDVAERQTADDVFQLIGVTLESARERSPWISFRYRFPWLLCNITGGVACAFLMSRYEAFLDHAIVLALFVPVVLALAESVSVQSTSITLQGMHKGKLCWGMVSKALRREFAIAGLLGLACGGLVALIAYSWKRQSEVAYALGTAITLSMLTACMLGVALPMLVRAVRGDPRIAAGPLVLAGADLATLSLYLSLSNYLITPA